VNQAQKEVLLSQIAWDMVDPEPITRELLDRPSYPMIRGLSWLHLYDHLSHRGAELARIPLEDQGDTLPFIWSVWWPKTKERLVYRVDHIPTTDTSTYFEGE